MDILEKLKFLASSGKSPEEMIQEIEKTQKNENLKENHPPEELPDYLECTVDQTNAVLQIIENIKVAKANLASLLILYENKKSSFIEEIKLREEQLLQSLDSLRLEYSLPGDMYEASIPASPAEKVSFVKKRSLEA